MNIKLFLFSLAVTSFAFAWAPVSTQAATVNPYQGRLVKSPSSSAVYYVGIDQKRHAFPNQKIYFSWYANFAKVEIISDFELSLYPLGENVLYRPGSRLLKIPDVPEVYAVEPGGRLRNIVSEEAAISLFGQNWSKKVDDIDISFFFDYEIEGVVDIVNGKAVFPRGTLVNFDGSNYVVDKRSDGIFVLRPVTADAWIANRFDLMERQTIVDPALREFFEIGLPVATAEPYYSCPSCPSRYYGRDSVAQTFPTRSLNYKYGLDVPFNWAVRFPEDTNQVTEVIEFETAVLERSFSVYRFKASDYGGELSALIAEHVEAADPDTIAFRGASLFLPEGVDLITHVPEDRDVEAPGYIYWDHFVVRGDNFYQLRFYVQEHLLSASADLIDVMMRTYQINPSVVD